MEGLRLHTFPKSQFDPDKIAYNITTVLNIKPYNHEANDFENLLHGLNPLKNHSNGQGKM